MSTANMIYPTKAVAEAILQKMQASDPGASWAIEQWPLGFKIVQTSGTQTKTMTGAGPNLQQVKKGSTTNLQIQAKAAEATMTLAHSSEPLEGLTADEFKDLISQSTPPMPTAEAMAAKAGLGPWTGGVTPTAEATLKALAAETPIKKKKPHTAAYKGVSWKGTFPLVGYVTDVWVSIHANGHDLLVYFEDMIIPAKIWTDQDNGKEMVDIKLPFAKAKALGLTVKKTS